MDSFEWNKIIGWILAAAIAVLGLSIVSGAVYDTDRPDEMGFFVDVPEEALGGTEEIDPMVELALAMQEVDIAKGEAVFKKCTACHTIEQGGANKQGPNLWGVMGRDIGSHPGFAYSSALQEEPGVWDWETMNAYILNPRGAIPGNVMSFAGIGDPEDRANLFAYMNAMGSDLPMPEPPAEALAEDADPEGTGPEAAKAEDTVEAELDNAALNPEGNIGGPAAENQDTEDNLVTD